MEAVAMLRQMEWRQRLLCEDRNKQRARVNVREGVDVVQGSKGGIKVGNGHLQLVRLVFPRVVGKKEVGTTTTAQSTGSTGLRPRNCRCG